MADLSRDCYVLDTALRHNRPVFDQGRVRRTAITAHFRCDGLVGSPTGCNSDMPRRDAAAAIAPGW